MSWFKENRLSVLINYINIIFILRLITTCYRIQNFNYIMVTILYILGTGLYWIYYEFIESSKHKVLAILSLFAAVTAALFLGRAEVVKFFNETIVVNYNKINDALYAGSFTYFEQYKPFVVILIPIIGYILMFLNSKGISNGVLILTFSIMLFFWYLEYVDEVKTRTVTLVILGVLTYTVNSYLKNLKHIGKLGMHVALEKNKIISYIIIYSLIIGWIGVLLPQQYEGKFTEVSENGWKNPFGPIIGDSPSKAIEGKYGLEGSGYNDTESKLGGPIQLTDELILKVETDRPYYLKADVKEFYTGTSWKKQLEEYVKEADLSTLEINKYLSSFNILNRMQPNKTMKIFPQKVTTNTVFVPSYVKNVSMDKGTAYYEKNALTFLSTDKENKEYNVNFYDPYSVIDAVKRNLPGRDISFTRTNYEKYLQVPNTVTVRTVELVYSIVKDKRTNLEKVEAIKDYLSKNYRYSLEVSNIPQGVDFVDYFLFTEKKGYCVYFATAMTIMTRIAGIPARYAEGFKMPDNPVDGVYEVTNEQAHAWSEVLIRQQPEVWATMDCSTTPAEERQRIQNLPAGSLEQGNTTPEETDANKTPNNSKLENELLEEEGAATKVLPVKLIVMVSFAAILVLYVLIRLLFFIIRKHKMIKLPSCIPLYNYLLKRLRVVSIKKSELETDMEFANGIYDIYLKFKMKDLVSKVYDEFYGGVVDESFDKLELYMFVEDYIRQRQSPVKYYFLKYFM